MDESIVVHCDEVIKPLIDSKGSKENIEKCDISISAAIIVRNEERCILRCIKSILDEVDEIVVVDTGSDDCTIEIIRSIATEKIKLYYQKWEMDFSSARNHAIEKSTKEWIFFIDADEYFQREEFSLKKILCFVEDLSYISNIVVAPIIQNIDGNAFTGVGRAFRKDSGIKYYGKVHEEPRKYIGEKRVSTYQIGLKILLKHDGYCEKILTEKAKRARNIPLVKRMMEIEPENPRWAYFYLRDEMERISFEEYSKFMEKYLFVDMESGCHARNLKQHPYTYALVSIYATKSFLCKKFEEVKVLVDLMDTLNPGNSDSVYLRTYSEICLQKQREKKVLKDLLLYRKAHLEPQYGTLHSEGKHIDLLIGYLLFQTGHIKTAFKYFQVVQEIGEGEMLFEECKSRIKNIKGLETFMDSGE